MTEKRNGRLVVPRDETFALECAIRANRNHDKLLRDIGMDVDPKIAKASADLAASLKRLRGRLVSEAPSIVSNTEER